MYLFPKLYQKGRISELFPQYFSLFFFPFNKTIVLFLLIGSLIFMDIFSLPFLRNRLIPRTKRAISEFPLLLYISFFLFTKNNCLFLFCFLLIFCHSSSFFSVYISQARNSSVVRQQASSSAFFCSFFHQFQYLFREKGTRYFVTCLCIFCRIYLLV